MTAAWIAASRRVATLLAMTLSSSTVFAVTAAVWAAPLVSPDTGIPPFALRKIAVPAIAKEAFAPFAKMRIGAAAFAALSCTKGAHSGQNGAPFICAADLKFRGRPYLGATLKFEGRDGQLTSVVLYSIPWFFKSGSGSASNLSRLDEAELQAYHTLSTVLIDRFARCESDEAKAEFAYKLLSGWNLAAILGQDQPYEKKNNKGSEASCAFTEGWHMLSGVGPKDPLVLDSLGLNISPQTEGNP